MSEAVFKYGIAECGHPSNRSKKECAACARKRYYASSEVIKQKIKDGNNQWAKQNRNRRNVIVHRWQDKYGQRPPKELVELRRAVKQLEKAVAQTNKRKRVGDDDE